MTLMQDILRARSVDELLADLHGAGLHCIVGNAPRPTDCLGTGLWRTPTPTLTSRSTEKAAHR